MKLKNVKSFFLKNNLFNKSIKVLFLRILGVLIFFSLTLFLTNLYPANLVGRYDFSRSFLMFLGAIVVLGMQQSIIYYSGYYASKNELYKLKAVYLKMLKIMLFISLIIAFSFLIIDNGFLNTFFQKNVSGIIIKTISALFFYGLTVLNIEVFRAIDKIFISEAFRNIFRYIFFLIAIVFLFYIGNKSYLLDVFLLNFVFLGVLSTSLLAFFFNRYQSDNGMNTNKNIGFKNIIKRSSPMAISSIAFILMQSIDVVLLGKFTNFKMVAYYAVTVKLTMFISLALTSVNAVLAPKISELFALGQHQKLKVSIRNGTRLIFALTIPAIAVLFIFSNYILNFFGKEYVVAKNTLFILLLGQAVNALCGSVGIYMNMTGKQNILQVLLISALFINLILNWILIPKYGILGAAIATSISTVFWNIIGATYLYKKDKIKTFLS